MNADLYNVNIIPNSACRCRAQFETAEHFFFFLQFCNLYNIQRPRLIQSLNQNLVIDFTLLTNGSHMCKYGENKDIVLAARRYIKDTKVYQRYAQILIVRHFT